MSVEQVSVSIEEIPEGRPLRVKVGERAILFIKDGDTLAVFLDRCPHKGMSMRHGTIIEGRLICPYHQYPFSLEDGSTTMRRCGPAVTIPFEREGDTVRASVNLEEIESVYQQALEW